jgi:3-deoxy-alpha-D-manno-octulosonate 8-oxidase
MSMRLTKTVGQYLLGLGAFRHIKQVLPEGTSDLGRVVYLIDHFFSTGSLVARLPLNYNDTVLYVNTGDEPTTEQVDKIVKQLLIEAPPHAIVGIGGGSTMDIAKAVSNLLTNGGNAADYQGWDLRRVPGIFKVGVPDLRNDESSEESEARHEQRLLCV